LTSHGRKETQRLDIVATEKIQWVEQQGGLDAKSATQAERASKIQERE
jgi:hypothetical protein